MDLIKDQNALLREQNEMLQEQNAILKEQNAILKEQNAVLKVQNTRVIQRLDELSIKLAHYIEMVERQGREILMFRLCISDD